MARSEFERGYVSGKLAAIDRVRVLISGIRNSFMSVEDEVQGLNALERDLKDYAEAANMFYFEGNDDGQSWT